ncbi:Excitatory amino acid transporter [Pseudolycoriella hygida]|uniref:Amino acid transporter n=1 Tax=Pseudolycoriella hygida TaxID=35572 RepID=A0A9Q0NCP3_9DIPT|nr:Excitatory amino acid transporter [Pseudolycoriella hygida]
MKPTTEKTENILEEHTKPIRNSKLKNVINKNLLLILTLAGVAVGIVVDNLFQTTFQQTMTTFVSHSDATNENPILVRQLTERPGVNTMGIVVFCLTFGTLLSTIGERGQVVKDFFSAIFEVTSKLITTIVWLTGVAVASFIAGKLLSIENLFEVFSQLALFIFCVGIGLTFHQLMMLPLIYFIFLRKQPYKFLGNLMGPWITAFATSSSAVTLPTTLSCMNIKMQCDSRVSKFVLTLGVNLNTNGTAMFLAISSIFISRLDGASLTYSTLFTILLMATISSMSIPSAPSSSLVMLLVILTTIDVDPRDISLLFAVDWILDRCRTTSNVIGDCFAAAVVESFCKIDLAKMEATSGIQQKSVENEMLIQSA